MKKVKFSLIQACYWCSYAAFNSYIIIYLQDQGMSATLCGLLITVYTLMGFIGQFVIGYLCDKFKTNKKVYIGAYLLAAVLIFLTYSSSNWALVIFLFGCLGFVQQPMLAVHDTWILKTYSKTPWYYGPIRSFGSSGFAIFNLFYGDYLGEAGYNSMLIFSFGFIIIGVVVSLLTPDAPFEEVKEKKEKAKSGTYKTLLCNKKLLAILILMLGVGMIHNPLFQLTALLISESGGNETFLGYALFTSAMSQVPMFLIVSKLKHISPTKKIMAGGLLYCASGIGNAFATTPMAVVLFMCFAGLGLGLFTATAREMITLVSPPEYLTSAQSLGDSMLFCLAGVISNVLAGTMFDLIGKTSALLILSGVAILSIVIFFIMMKSNSKTDPIKTKN